MKKLINIIGTLILTFVMAACGQSKSPSKERQAAESYDYRVIETAPVYVDSLKRILRLTPARKQRSPLHPQIPMMMAIWTVKLWLKKTDWLESQGCRWVWMMTMRNMKMDLMTAMRNSLSCYQQLYEELTS